MAIKYILACLVLLALAGNAVGEFSVKATTGSGIGGSSTEVSYGATVKDLVNDQMQLDSQGGTLSHAFAGTGSLPYLSLAINDASGNYATAWRSVSGKTGTTTWSYDWGTSRPASGVSAWLSMNAQKAYSINGGSRASNKEGDVASTETLISSKGSDVISDQLLYIRNGIQDQCIFIPTGQMRHR